MSVTPLQILDGSINSTDSSNLFAFQHRFFTRQQAEPSHDEQKDHREHRSVEGHESVWRVSEFESDPSITQTASRVYLPNRAWQIAILSFAVDIYLNWQLSLVYDRRQTHHQKATRARIQSS